MRFVPINVLSKITLYFHFSCRYKVQIGTSDARPDLVPPFVM